MNNPGPRLLWPEELNQYFGTAVPSHPKLIRRVHLGPRRNKHSYLIEITVADRSV